MADHYTYDAKTGALLSHEVIPDPELDPNAPPTPDERLAALEDAVDTLILDTLGGTDV